MNNIWKKTLPEDTFKLVDKELYIYDGCKVCLGRYEPIHGHDSRMESLDGTQLDWEAWCYREELENHISNIDSCINSKINNLSRINKIYAVIHVRTDNSSTIVAIVDDIIKARNRLNSIKRSYETEYNIEQVLCDEFKIIIKNEVVGRFEIREYFVE